MAQDFIQRFASFIVRTFGGVSNKDADTRAREAFASGYNEGEDEPIMYLDGKPIGRGYRTTKSRPRDLSEISQSRATAAAYRIWNTNPLGKALTEIIVDYVLGDGPTITAFNEDVGEIIDRFWLDPVNQLEEELAESLVRELGVFGELLIPAFIQTGEDVGAALPGRVRLGTIDTDRIQYIITDADNTRHIKAVQLKAPQGGTDGPIYKLIRSEEFDGSIQGILDLTAYKQLVDLQTGDDETKRLTEADYKEQHSKLSRRLTNAKKWGWVDDEEKGTTKLKEAHEIDDEAFNGQAFYFQINKFSSGLRGRPDGLQAFDWLDRFDQVFFDGSEHAQLLNQIVWDATIEGGSSTDDDPDRNLQAQANKIASIPPGGVYTHNEKVILKAVTPDLKTADLAVLIRSLRVFITGAYRIPEHWVAEGGSVTRTTAKEMGQPTFRMLKRRQDFVRNMFEKMIQFAIDVAVELGHLPEEVPVTDDDGVTQDESVPARQAFEIKMPDINVEDTTMISSALSSVAQAIVPLVSMKVLPVKPAIEIIASIVSNLGVEIDIEEAMDAAAGADLDQANVSEIVNSLMAWKPEDKVPEWMEKLVPQTQHAE